MRVEELDLVLKRGERLRIRRLHQTNPRATLVFLHDSLGCIELWRDFPERLAQASACSVLIYDRQGYGRSSPFSSPRIKMYHEQEARILAELLAECEISKPILFGHSDGGTIALLAAAIFPSKITGIITEGAHVFVEDVTLNGIRTAEQHYKSSDLEARLKRYHGDNTQAIVKAWIETWLDPQFSDWNIESYLPKIRCPALIIQGDQDEYGSQNQIDAICSQISGPTQKCWLPGRGHNPHKEAPAEIISVALNFIESTLKE